MKKGIFSLMMGLILAFTGLVRANELTVNDGTQTQRYTPVYTYYGDTQGSAAQFVVPADQIAVMNGAQITSMRFYIDPSQTYNGQNLGGPTYAGYMTEVSGTTMSSFIDFGTATQIFSGHLSLTNNDSELVIDFATPYTYNGGNLAIAFTCTQSSGYCSLYYYSVAATGGSIYRNSSSASGTVQNYLPKTTFTYSGGGSQPAMLSVNPDPVELGARPNNCWMRPFVVELTNEGAANNITGIDFEDNYFVPELGELVIPFAIGHNETVEFAVSTGVGNGDMACTLDIDYGDVRTAVLFDVHAFAYEPVEPDVWEMARVVTSYPYRDTPTTVALYNNYVLPPTDVEDGNDAVYKVTFDHDVMLNGNVVTVGGIDKAENGKMVVYTRAGIDEVGGPDLNNNYTGPTVSSSEPMTMTAYPEGLDGTTTVGTLPMYGLYADAYTRSQYVIPATEIAQMAGCPINSLTYYTASNPTPWQSNFQVYLTEVNYTTVSSLIDPATATTVYTGQLVIADGMMHIDFATPYQYNGGNLLIGMDCLECNNYSSCYFKAVSMTGAGMYAYNYNAPTFTSPYTVNYAPTTTFGYMGRSRNRAEEVVFSDDFESGSATGWDIQNEGTYNGWELASSDGWGHYAQGSYAMFDMGSYSGYYNDLYSPSIDLTNATSATLSFDYINPSWSGDYNYLAVYAYVPAESYWYLLGEPTAPMASWTTITYDLTPYCGKEIQINFYDDFEYGYGTGIDNVVVTAEMGAPVPPVPGDQLITNMTMLPGTYYIAASSTADAWDVILNASELPCPDEITAEANCVEPADDSDGIDPSSVTLKWHLSPYTTEYRLVFGSTYYCENVLVDWTRDLADSYTVTGLFNNTNYFWRIEERNDGCPQGVVGPVWGFTTTFNAPTNLHATNANGNNIYENETLHLAWTPIVDRTFRSYNIYMDGELIGSTPSNPNPTATTTYDVEGLTYTYPGFHIFNVTAVYDEGESWISNDLLVTVSGEGSVEGYVYEQDGVTGIANATVTMTGIDEFGRPHTYTFTTDANGYYTGAMLAGTYSGMAACAGYQDVAYENNPFQIVYNELTPDINFIMDEVYTPVGEVIAEYYPDPEDPESPYVKVYWGWNVMSSIIEDFETGDFSQFDWNIPAQYPFEITTTNPYEGTYCMQSTNYNVSSSTSSIDVTVEIPRDGLMSFYERVSCESSWDNAYFYIDGVQKGTYTGTSNWTLKEYEVTEGEHNFKWEYTKDGSVNSGEDRFFIDYIDFIHDAQPLEPGWIYYDNGVNVDAVGLTAGGSFMWGVRFPASMMAGFAGCSLTKVSLFDYTAHTGKVMIYQGGATAPGTLIHQQPYTCTGSSDFVETTLTSALPIDPTQDLWVIMNNDNGQYVASCCDDTGDPNGRWISTDGVQWDDIAALGLPDTWMIRAYVSDGAKNRVLSSNNKTVEAIEPSYTLSNASLSDLALDPAQTEPVVTGKANSNDRSFQYFRVYRTDCYNDGPYTSENTVVCCCELHDTLYIDVEWPELAPGVYKWGVGCVYGGNRESEITWANIAAPANMTESNLPANIDKDRMAPVVAVRNTPAKIRHNDNMNRDSFRGTTAYGCNVYGTVIPTGLFSMDIDNPTGASLLSTMALNACEYVDGMLYAYTDDAFMVIDPATGSVNSQVAVTDYPTEMAYDYSSNTMYAYSAGVLYTINMTTGAMTQVALVINEEGTNIGVSGLAADLNGTLYAMGTGYAYLYSINKTTGDATYIGGDGVNDDLWPYYLSSGAIDYATNTMYWENSDYMGPDELYAVDLTTGAATFVCNFVETLGLTFEYTATPGPTPDPDPSDIQEPRESPIVWSNCLDKDMYLNGAVDITVLLNSADSPEGVEVSFTNLNAGEQELYPVEPVVLDGTGYYVWDTFRRGNYVVSVTNGDAYEPITDTVSIWDATSLRYVMIEIIYGVSDLYVSHTGWAMWTGQGPQPVPPTPDETEFTEDFENGLNGWNVLDVVQGEGTWVHSDDNLGGYDYTAYAHSGTGFAMGYSFVDYVGSFNIDSYLYTPQKYSIVNGSTLTFWADNANDSYPENFSVCVATADNPTAADFTQVWAGGAKAGNAAKSDNRHNGNRSGNWRQHTIDLSAYAGQNVYIAFHDVNYDAYEIWIDDVELTAGAKNGGERHLEGYKVLCTSIDGEPIFSGNTVNPFIQVDTDELVEGENYICKVAAIYSTGMSDWTEAIWQYKSCENYGEAQDVAAEGQTVTWNYPAGPVPPPPGPGDEFTVDFENGMPAGWTTLDANNDGYNWVLGTQVGGVYLIPGASLEGSGHNSSYDMICSGSYDNNTYNAITPDNYLVSPQVTLASGSTFSFWACAQDGGYPAEHFGVFVSDNGTDNWTSVQEWTMTSKSGSEVMSIGRGGNTRAQGSWHQYTVDLSAFAGQKYIAIRHFNCNDQFLLDVDDIELAINAKSGNRDEYIQYCTESFSGGVGTGGGEVWWAVKFPATSLAAYAGQSISKLGVYTDVDGDYGWTYSGNYELSVFAGTSAPTTLLGGTGMQYVAGDLAWHDLELPTAVAIDGTQDLWIVGHTTDIAYPMSGCDYVGDANSDYLSLDNSTWEHAGDYGLAYTWMLRAFVTGGSPVPPDPTGNVLGAMIFRDGEWIAEVAYPTNEYTDEEGSGNYCVRIIYNGNAVLPDNNEYYSMSCPVCAGDPVGCAPGAPIRGEYVWNNAEDFGALISWGAVTPGPGDEFTEGFESGSIPTGWTTIDADGDGFNWTPASVWMAGYIIPFHGGADCITSASYYNYALTPDNYLVSPQVAITNGSTFSFWACAQDPSYAAEHYGVAISTTGNTNAADFTTIAEWTMTAKDAAEAGAYMSKNGKGTREGNWYQKTVDLSAYAGQQVYIAIRHFNCTDEFYLNVDDAELAINAKGNRAGELVKYNVYRSADNVEYEFIGSVDAAAGQEYYEYFDATAAGTYYYQVRAEYSDGCESEPAISEANPANNYVIVNVTSVAENGEIALYPNPTNGNITIQAQNMNRITVVSVLGQVVYDAEVEGDSQIINMAQFNAGVYMVRIATENGVSTQRVTVVK